MRGGQAKVNSCTTTSSTSSSTTNLLLLLLPQLVLSLKGLCGKGAGGWSGFARTGRSQAQKKVSGQKIHIFRQITGTEKGEWIIHAQADHRHRKR